MTGVDGFTLLAAALAAIAAAITFNALIGRFWSRFRFAPLRALPQPSANPVYLFEGDTLVHASPNGLQLIGNRPHGMSERNALFQLLQGDFPTLPQDFDTIARGETRRLTPLNGSSLILTLAAQGDTTRLTLGAMDGEDVDLHYAGLARSAASAELALLRDLVNQAPQLIWREDMEGRLIWANRAYLTYSDRSARDQETAAHVWPGRRLFPDLPVAPPEQGRTMQSRVSVQLSGEKAEHWFDVTTIAVDNGLARFATEANAVVRAENARREFTQTLSKTFAQLSAGLAIFDRQRKLTTFNPALMELTGLPVDFLSARPSIEMVLNRLRDLRRLPEHRNFMSWREQFLSVEAEAKRGTYAENWALPDGQTFRVTGRPYPDGALAFMFEDISAEISLARHFRSELETSQAVIDTMSEAVAVFSSANTLVLTNQAYRALWPTEYENTLNILDLRAAMSIWKAASQPSTVWQRLEAFATTFETRGAWSDPITLLDGRQVVCHAIPLPNRMTLVRFEILSSSRAALTKLVAEATHAPKLVSN